MALPSVSGPGQLLIGLTLVLPLVILLPVLMLRAFKRSLRLLMRTEAAPIPPANSAVEATPHPRSPLKPTSSLLTLARARQRRCALIYAAGGACCAPLMTLALMGESGVHNPAAFLTIVVINLWPVMLSLRLIFGWSRRFWLSYTALYLGILSLLGYIQHLRGGSVGFSILLAFFLILNAPPTIFSTLVSLKSIRQVGPTLLPFCLAVILGPQELLHLGATRFSFSLAIVHLAQALALNSLEGILLAVLLTLLAMALLGWLLATLLVSLYRKHRISDQSLLLDSFWVIFIGCPTLILSTRTGTETGSGTLWIVLALPVYLLVVHLGVRLPQPSRTSSGPSLLVLRAFALGPKAEALFQPLTTLWRYLGPVRLIGGPDLATTTVDPAIFLDFALGRLPRLFLRSQSDLDTRFNEPNAPADPDGRFRIQSFFCFNNTWQPAVATLLRTSDVILADFRGLARTKGKGCEWEVQEIVRAASLTRCVFLLEAPNNRKKTTSNGSLNTHPDSSLDDLYLHSLLTAAAGKPIDPASIHILHPGDQSGQALETILSALSAHPRGSCGLRQTLPQTLQAP